MTCREQFVAGGVKKPRDVARLRDERDILAWAPTLTRCRG